MVGKGAKVVPGTLNVRKRALSLSLSLSTVNLSENASFIRYWQTFPWWENRALMERAHPLQYELNPVQHWGTAHSYADRTRVGTRVPPEVYLDGYLGTPIPQYPGTPKYTYKYIFCKTNP